MHPTHTPELLDALADRATVEGADHVASELRACAAQWRREQQSLHVAQADATALQHRIQRQAQRATHNNPIPRPE